MARKQKMIHYLYKTTCLVTGRYYVGMHSTNNLDDGYMGSGKRLRYSIRKYGINNHKKEIIKFFETRELLIEAEKEAITPEMIIDNNCMNLKGGGEGGFSNEKHKENFLTYGVKNGRLACDKKLKEKHGDNFLSVISKINWSKLKNDYDLMNDFIVKVKQGQIKSGFENGCFFGKKHSDETKIKMSESSKGTGVGKTNSQYGTCWITKEKTNKKIKKEELNSYLEKGWVKGRK
jgi:hypothetical protein